MSDLSWLPELVRLEDFQHDWESYIEHVYAMFHRDFCRGPICVFGRTVSIGREPVIDDKEATFWHLTSEGSEEAARTPDLRRCERIQWPAAMLQAVGTSRVCTWKTRRDRSIRLLISLTDFSFVVILAERPRQYYLITAYWVEYQKRRDKLRKEWEDAQSQ